MEAKLYNLKFIQAGVVGYPENGKQVLIREETLRDKIAPTVLGKPSEFLHKEDAPALGYATTCEQIGNGFWTILAVGDDLANEKLASGWSFSCTLTVTEKSKEGGIYNGVKYDYEVLNGYIKNIAIVEIPRYDVEFELLNSLDIKETEGEVFMQEEDKKESVSNLYNKEEMKDKYVLNKNGEKVMLSDLVNSYMLKNACDDKNLYNSDMIDIDGETVSISELLEAFEDLKESPEASLENETESLADGSDIESEKDKIKEVVEVLTNALNLSTTQTKVKPKKKMGLDILRNSIGLASVEHSRITTKQEALKKGKELF